MKRWIVGLVGAALLAGGGFLLVTRKDNPRIPRTVFEQMKFPQGGANFVGDPASGAMCHEVHKWDADKKEWVLWTRHTIPGRDFRNMTPGERMDAIIADTVRDMEALDLLACARPSDWFPGAAGEAWADPPHCSDCGGGCGSVSCPAHNQPPCRLGGDNCTLTFVCCSPPCGSTCE